MKGVQKGVKGSKKGLTGRLPLSADDRVAPPALGDE